MLVPRQYITGKYKHSHLEDDLKELHWPIVRKRVLFKIGLLSFKSVIGHAHYYLYTRSVFMDICFLLCFFYSEYNLS